MDVKEELLKRLDVLAEKLGTSSKYLWEVLDSDLPESLLVGGIGGSYILAAILAFCSVYTLQIGFLEVTNPQFYAFQQIIQAMGK